MRSRDYAVNNFMRRRKVMSGKSHTQTSSYLRR